MDRDIDIDLQSKGCGLGCLVPFTWGTCVLLTTVLVILKGVGQVDWPWVWVVSPLWITFSVSLLVVVGTITLGVVVWLCYWVSRGD